MAKTKIKRPKMTRYTFKDFEKQFPNDEACLDWLKDYLYPDGIFCQPCDKVTKHHKIASRRSYSCQYCGHHVHPTADTIYHKSSMSLKTWFHAIYLMASTRCGISAKQLERETGVTYKTAWRMAKQIRSMLNESPGTLMGRVEIDDTYVGGKRSGGKTGRGAPGKTVVLGMVERQGPVVAKVVPNLKIKTVMPIIKDTIPSTHTEVFSDELAVYERIH